MAIIFLNKSVLKNTAKKCDFTENIVYFTVYNKLLFYNET